MFVSLLRSLYCSEWTLLSRYISFLPPHSGGSTSASNTPLERLMVNFIKYSLLFITKTLCFRQVEAINFPNTTLSGQSTQPYSHQNDYSFFLGNKCAEKPLNTDFNCCPDYVTMRISHPFTSKECFVLYYITYYYITHSLPINFNWTFNFKIYCILS